MAILTVKVTKYKCDRCNYEWFPKNLKNVGEPPLECASCHNSYWNRPYKNKQTQIKKSGKKMTQKGRQKNGKH